MPKYHVTADDISKIEGGNIPDVGDSFPFIITKDWGNSLVNGRVFLDGPSILWVTSVRQGTDPGQWEPE